MEHVSLGGRSGLQLAGAGKSCRNVHQGGDGLVVAQEILAV